MNSLQIFGIALGVTVLPTILALALILPLRPDFRQEVKFHYRKGGLKELVKGLMGCEPEEIKRWRLQHTT